MKLGETTADPVNGLAMRPPFRYKRLAVYNYSSCLLQVPVVAHNAEDQRRDGDGEARSESQSVSSSNDRPQEVKSVNLSVTTPS